jgi:CheY-like chemotaxis protein/predicted regulator of Ras-like GTPase activity (Roadblock/LC7/MglB family)
MARKILVVDRNEAFATMLREMLENDGGYQVEVAQSGSDALMFLIQDDYDLTIVDMDLDSEDMSYDDLLLNVRLVRPAMRLMLIPLMGETLPVESSEVEIQGVLSKPFFADDLLPAIQDVLAKEVSSPIVTEVVNSPASGEGEPSPTEIQGVLAELAREIHADTILLVSYRSGSIDVVARHSTSADADAGQLADLVLEIVVAAQAAARFLDQANRPFDHAIFEGGPLSLYVMMLSGDLVLVVVAPASTPLGTIRHNLRRTKRDLAEYALT